MITPWSLAGDSEHSQQSALFCFCAKVKFIGFELALDKTHWEIPGYVGEPVPEIEFYHSIPNGGNRGDNATSRAVQGGKLKAEGVKAGVLDTFWPIARGGFHGLYVEMKKPSLKKSKNQLNGLSDAQLKFGEFVTNQGYQAIACYTWLEAADALKQYYELDI